MKKIIIKGNFTIEGDAINTNNIAQPLSISEIEVEEQFMAMRMMTFTSASLKEKSNEGISENDWKVVEKRLESMPDDFSIGFSCKSFTKEELMIEVKGRTESGKIYVDMQLGFIKWLLKQSGIK